MALAALSRLWLLALLPVLWLLARPPRPRRRQLTAHLAAWRAALAAVGRRPVRFRRLRFLLLVIAFVALVFASVRPRVGAVPGPRRLAIVVDASASMAARGTPAAVEVAVGDVVAALPQHVAVDLLAAGRILGFDRDIAHADVAAAARAIAAAATGDAASVDLASVVRQLFAATRAGTPVEPDEAPAVLTVTDGLGAAAPPPPLEGALRIVGDAQPNVGIVAARVRDDWPATGFAVDVELIRRPRGDGPSAVDLQMKLDGAAVARGRCAFAGDGSGRIEVRATRPIGVAPSASARAHPHELVVELDRESVDGAGDALRIDDAVAFELPPLPAPDIAVLTQDARSEPWLGTVAAMLAELGGGQVVDAASGRAGLVIADGGRVARLPRRGILFGTAIGAETSAWAVRRDSTLRDWDRDHPLLRGIDLSGLAVRAALAPPAGFGGHVLIAGESGPLALGFEREAAAGEPGASVLWTAFRLCDSDLPLRAALPQLLRRVYRASFGVPPGTTSPLPGSLLDPVESDLGVRGEVPFDRELPEFGRPGFSLVVPLILLALLALAARMFA